MTVALEQAIAAGSVVVLDTSTVLAYLDGGEPASAAATTVIDGFVRSGRNRGLISAVTVTEALVRPFRLTAGPESAEPAIPTVEDFLQHFPNLGIVTIDYSVAREAARVRARTGLRTADALVLATAIVSEGDAVVGNDEHWNAAVDKLGNPFAYCYLAAYSG